MSEPLAIEVRQLSFTYTQGAEASPVRPEQTLEDIDLLLGKGARCLLIGANGCESLATADGKGNDADISW